MYKTDMRDASLIKMEKILWNPENSDLLSLVAEWFPRAVT